jgi:ABC-type uncharacterized transport system auxiliary subunit
MTQRKAVAAGLAAFLVLGACQTWQDKADAEMLADCAKIADPAERKTCQTEVITAYGDAERALKEKQVAEAKAREERETLKEVYGLPDRAH